jgi:VWFA-related protein
MKIPGFFKISCVAFSLLMLMACGGGGGDSAPPASTPNISLAQSSYDFAGIVLANSADRTFEIQNTGNASLVIGQISPLNPPFSIASDTCSGKTLAPTRTCSLGIRFSPTSQVSSTATLSIPSNDPDTSTVTISLSGEGYELNVWISKVNSSICPDISVDVTVTDPAIGGLLTLTKDDFELYHNGQLQQIITLDPSLPSPVSLVLALDWSSSLGNVLNEIRSGAKSFINQMQAGDFAAICKFASLIGFSPSTGLTETINAGKTALNGYIDDSFSGGNWTHLYDAVYQSIDRAAEGTTAKRAVIILSDGNDESGDIGGSPYTLDQVIVRAKAEAIPIFTIYYVDEVNFIGKPEILQRLSSETGGQFYNALNADFTVIFQQISNTLSNKYTLNYTASPPTCTGTISVRAESGTSYGQDSISFP